MALFFDAAWFDAQLTERGISRRVMAAAAGMSDADLTLVFKDQRELTAQEVAAFAELLGVAPAEIARQAGVSTPVPGGGRRRGSRRWNEGSRCLKPNSRA
jgi:lambda repressor-like predicted transcriptional regulator